MMTQVTWSGMWPRTRWAVTVGAPLRAEREDGVAPEDDHHHEDGDRNEGK